MSKVTATKNRRLTFDVACAKVLYKHLSTIQDLNGIKKLYIPFIKKMLENSHFSFVIKNNLALMLQQLRFLCSEEISLEDIRLWLEDKFSENLIKH